MFSCQHAITTTSEDACSSTARLARMGFAPSPHSITPAVSVLAAAVQVRDAPRTTAPSPCACYARRPCPPTSGLRTRRSSWRPCAPARWQVRACDALRNTARCRRLVALADQDGSGWAVGLGVNLFACHEKLNMAFFVAGCHLYDGGLAGHCAHRPSPVSRLQFGVGRLRFGGARACARRH